MAFYRKKPVVVEAVQWTGDNVDEIKEFMKDATYGFFVTSKTRSVYMGGLIFARPGSYIIKEKNGEFYSCEPGIFAETYEEVNE